MNAPAWLSAVPDIAQIAFWIVLGTVAVLTYRQARRTILQPLRTEVFKLQLDAMSRLLKLLVGKGEVELRRDSGEPETFNANVYLMLDVYARTRFGIEVDKDDRPYSIAKTPVWRMHPSRLQPADERVLPAAQEDGPNSAGEPLSWDGWSHLSVPMSSGYVEWTRSLNEFLEDPLVPARCAELIQALLDVADARLDTLSSVLSEVGSELPTAYPDPESLNSASFSWIENRFNERAPTLQPAAAAVVAFARDYFGSDEFSFLD